MEKQTPTVEFRTGSGSGKEAAGETSNPLLLKPRKTIHYLEDKIPGSLHIIPEIDIEEVNKLREKYWIPQSVELVTPTADWRACSPPEGYGTVYKDQLEAGFRIPAHKFWSLLVKYYHFSLAQLTPSAIFCVVHFLAGCAEKKVTPTVELFRYFFQVKKSPKDIGFLTINSRKNREFRGKKPR